MSLNIYGSKHWPDLNARLRDADLYIVNEGPFQAHLTPDDDRINFTTVYADTTPHEDKCNLYQSWIGAHRVSWRELVRTGMIEALYLRPIRLATDPPNSYFE